jgi:hypothetical protein
MRQWTYTAVESLDEVRIAGVYDAARLGRVTLYCIRCTETAKKRAISRESPPTVEFNRLDLGTVIGPTGGLVRRPLDCAGGNGQVLLPHRWLTRYQRNV